MRIVTTLAAAAALLLPAGAIRAQTGLSSDAPLYRTQQALDAALFGAYNRCELDAFGALVDPAIEFYHDQGGLSTGRAAIVDAVRRNICGKVRRELVEGSFEVHEMHGYGALTIGFHRFCELANQDRRCDGIARFAMLWQQREGQWFLTRVLSFDHRANRK